MLSNRCFEPQKPSPATTITLHPIPGRACARSAKHERLFRTRQTASRTAWDWQHHHPLRKASSRCPNSTVLTNAVVESRCQIPSNHSVQDIRRFWQAELRYTLPETTNSSSLAHLLRGYRRLQSQPQSTAMSFIPSRIELRSRPGSLLLNPIYSQ